MPELLVEVGCEELPASQVESAFNQLRDGICRRLSEARLSFGDVAAYGTPRRLVVVARDVAARQPDAEIEVRGPKVASAYDENGAPTKALEGFCRSRGVELSEVRTVGEHVVATQRIEGRSAREVLVEVLPLAIREISFEKTMRWGEGRMRFARPIRWLLALFNGEAIPVEVEGVLAGNRTRGHRILSPAEFEVAGFDDYVVALRAAFVEIDPKRRREMILEGAERLWPRGQGMVEADEAILAENVYLTEWPMPSLGAFEESFLQLPESVLIVAMKKHEKFLPLRDTAGKLAPRFVSVRNSGDEETVVRGNEWVLEARFADARFFFEEDTKEVPILPRFAAKLGRIVFQEKLGTLAAKTERLKTLCHRIADSVQFPEEEKALAVRAAQLAKADLATGLVMELPALQGLIGGEYAKLDGEAPEVCYAIERHYAPEEPPSDTPSKLARVLMAADRADTLCGYLGLGLTPSGSSDPFGLRRATHLLILNGREWGPEVFFPDLGLLMRWAYEAYAEQGHTFDMGATIAALSDLAYGRYELLYENVRHDLLAAVLGVGWEDPWKVAARIALLSERAEGPRFVEYVRTATRPGNIARAACSKGLAAGQIPSVEEVTQRLAEVDSQLFEHEAESALLRVASETAPEAVQFAKERHYARLYDLLHERFSIPIGAFFDNVMVMTEDEARRDNRLRLLSALAALYIELADFSKVVIEG